MPSRNDTLDRAAVESASNELVEAVNASDLERVVSLWTEDATLLPPHHPKVEGRESIRAYFGRLFSVMRLQFQFTSSRVWLAEGSAWQLVDYSAEVTPLAGGAVQSDRGKGLHVFRRQPSGSWLLALDIWNSDVAPAAMATPRRSLRLAVLPGSFAMNRAAPETPVPSVVGTLIFISITRTSEELAIAAPEEVVLDGFARDVGWRCMKVIGPLAFGEIGILADLSTALAAAGVPIAAISTYDTDYLLIKDSMLSRAVDALVAAGHRVTD